MTDDPKSGLSPAVIAVDPSHLVKAAPLGPSVKMTIDSRTSATNLEST